MKKARLLIGIFILVSILGVIFGQSESFAVEHTTFWVGLSELRSNNTPNSGYSIEYPPAEGTTPGKHIWDLISYNAQTGGSATNKNLYCVKGGVGYVWNSTGGRTTRVNYDDGYNIKTEKNAIEQLGEAKSVYKEIVGANYNNILWITDNMYIPGVSTSEERTALLKAAGIDYNKSPFLLTDEYDNVQPYPENMKITDDDIEVVQQMALWYFTNSDEYHVTNLNSIYIVNENTPPSEYRNPDYQAMSNYLKTQGIGSERLKQMNYLYNYLIEKNKTDKNSDKYDSTTNELGSPVTVSIPGESLGYSNGKVGPINVTKNNDLPYTLDFYVNDTKVTDESKFVNASGTKIDKDTASTIYVKVSETTDIHLKVVVNYKTSATTLWLPNNSNVEQPIIEVTKTPKTAEFEFETESTKVFDLALRKFISAVSTDGDFSNTATTTTYDRVPSVTGAWDSTNTTLVKTHPKNVLKVKQGDYIEYTIRVYNEGEEDGYAEQIKDYILNNQGLEYVTHSTNTQYGWTKSGNVVTTNYLSSSGGTDNLLTAYDDNIEHLSFKDVKIVFKVTEKNSSSSTLVNIAEISSAKDKNGNTMNADGDDRDSTPNTDKYNYPSNGYNTETHEDDIDYEPVEMKKFDLALQKYITAVSTDGDFSNSSTTTSYTDRAPVLTGDWNGTTLVKDHSRDPIAVQSGDYVLYTIRVYNEGEIDGYATEITDNIVDIDGLEYVTNHTINADNLWSVKSVNGDGKVEAITTDILAKGNGADEYTSGSNLIKAFKSNAVVSSTNPDYRDVQVVLKVIAPNTATKTLTNRAQVSKASDDSDHDLNNPGDDRDSTPNNGYTNEDDEDYDRVVLQFFDLSLRKFLTAVKTDGTTTYLTTTGGAGTSDSDGEYLRAPVVDTTSLVNGTTATYNHTKTPYEVSRGSNVIYTIRVYNEGSLDGYVGEIKDFLPEELVLAENSSINTSNGWTTVEGSNGRIVKTTKLANTKLNARTENASSSNPYTLSYEQVQIECTVSGSAQPGKKITNIAEISQYKDKNKNVVSTDRDSKADSLTDGDSSTGTLPSDSELPTYKDDQTGSYIPGQQDDDDFEKIVIGQPKYDLALRKYIVSVNGSEAGLSNRVPEIGNFALDNGTTTAKTHSKTPVQVAKGDNVVFRIEVYNEGDMEAKATKITDYIPSGLSYVTDSSINNQYGWSQVVTTGAVFETTALSERTLSQAGTKQDGTPDLDSDYVLIECKVTAEKVDGYNLRNIAAITGCDGTDVDSSPTNNPSNNSSYPTSSNPQGKGQEDDDDYDELFIPQYDLALRKFITSVKTTDGTTTNVSRTPNVDTVSLAEGTTATYNHSKNPYTVKKGSNVIYTIRVYNEGTIDAYALEVTDYLPEELSLAENSEINTQNGWTGSGRVVKTTALANKKIDARTSTGNSSNPYSLDYEDIQIECTINLDAQYGRKITNIAEISKYGNENQVEISEDIDSTPNDINLPSDNDLPSYKESQEQDTYVPGQEDDDDFEKIIIETPKYDLALRKFITAVNGQPVDSREPSIGNFDLDDGTTTAKTHSKSPVRVVKGNTVTYTIRVYNEGDMGAKATEITDYLPEGLEFISSDESTINNQNGWEVVAGSNGRIIKTTKLANTTISPVETTSEGKKIYREDIQVECKVVAEYQIGYNLRNIASITGDDGNDVDSSPEVNPTNDSSYPTTSNPQGKGQEDDDDYDDLYMPKYDLALRKFVTAVNGQSVDSREPVIGNYDLDDGTTTAKTHSKTPVAVAKGNTVTYTIRVYNEGDVEATATEITDYLPEGLEFIEPGTSEGQSSINQENGWQVVEGSNGKVVKTTKLANTTIAPVETTSEGKRIYREDIQIECRVIAEAVNGYNLRNLASITGDDGNDTDSSPEVNPTNDDNYPTTSEPQGKGQEDDDDYDNLYIPEYDLALRKFVSTVNGKEVTSRVPVIGDYELDNGTTTSKTHSKTPVAVSKGDKVVFTIRVYNEGQVAAKATEITDYLPEGLEFISTNESAINAQYEWEVVEGSNGKVVKTTALANTEILPTSEMASIPENEGATLDYKDVQIECRVIANVVDGHNLRNLASITGDNGNDTDSSPEVNPTNDDNYPTTSEPQGKGQEDDDDYDELYIRKFDLALRKFITNINGEEETSRIPEVDASKLISGESTTATYTHPKTPIKVIVGDIVVYTIRAYNEGDTDGYAAEIADDMPEDLIFLPDNAVNTTYRWKMYDKDGNVTEDISKAVQVKTDYLSKENETTEGENLIHAFDPSKETSDTNPDHKEVKIAFKVSTAAEVNKVIVNKAQVMENTDENGDPIDDIDSTPGEWIEGEDDQDVENIIPGVFDLNLIKYVSQVVVTEDGTTKTTNTGNTGNKDTDILPKVEVNKKKIDSTTVKFVYTIVVANEGDIAGYAKEVTDYVPEGLKFVEADNKGWTVKSDGTIATKALENTLLQPGQSASVSVVFTWINGASNLGLKRNWAEISEDYNDRGIPDRDSTPDNKVEGEDDIDYADVLLSIKTGAVQTFVLLGGSILIVLASGIILIKRYAI